MASFNRCCFRFMLFRLPTSTSNLNLCCTSNVAKFLRRKQLFHSHHQLKGSLIRTGTMTPTLATTTPPKPNPYVIDPNRIDEERAMLEYALDKEHLKNLPVAEMHPDIDTGRIFHLSDVRAKAELVHGKEVFEAMMQGKPWVNRKGEVIPPPGSIMMKKPKPSDQWRLTKQFWAIFGLKECNNAGEEDEQGERMHQPEDANKVVGFALVMNGFDFCIKLLAASLTWSKSLFAEAVHSFLDLCNQIILFNGNRISLRKPDPKFPYGYGNVKYICSMTSGFGILAAGCGFSIWNGAQGLYQTCYLGNPAHLESLSLGIGLLCISSLLQYLSFAKTNREINKRAAKEGLTLKQYLKSPMADPSLKVVYLEDWASLRGVAIALVCVSATHVLGMPEFDCIGSILIGGLLGHAAFTIISTNVLHLIGRSLPEEKKKEIINFMSKDPIVGRMYDVKVTYMGVNDYRFKAEIDYNGRELMRKYLHENGKLAEMRHELAQIKNDEELEEFMMLHGDKLIDKMGAEVDRLEQNTCREFPEIQHMDLESH